MKRATAYSRGGSYFLRASSRTDAGGWIATPPYFVVPADAAPTVKGDAAIKALANSREGVPHPTDRSGLVAPLLQLAGVRSFGAFMKGARCVSISADDQGIRIAPLRNLGGREGFEPQSAGEIELPVDASAVELGTAIEQAMGRCE